MGTNEHEIISWINAWYLDYQGTSLDMEKALYLQLDSLGIISWVVALHEYIALPENFNLDTISNCNAKEISLKLSAFKKQVDINIYS